MLKTEERNPHTMHIDRMETREMVSRILSENLYAVLVIKEEVSAITRAVDEITERMRAGGRLFYVGCGTSGRLGVLDASECPPTFGVDCDRVVGIIAGGDPALRRAAEGAEDSFESGYADLAAFAPTHLDSVVGISAAGGAPYVLGALKHAKEQGALCISLSSNAGCPIEGDADIAIHPNTGAEAITGSTRLKAGTAQKIILNMISTSVMVKLGYVYENLMINLRPTNQKLRRRMIGIVEELGGVDAATAEALLEANGFDIRRALDAGKET